MTYREHNNFRRLFKAEVTTLQPGTCDTWAHDAYVCRPQKTSLSCSMQRAVKNIEVDRPDVVLRTCHVGDRFGVSCFAIGDDNA